MAVDKLVDSTQLDGNLTSVANAIRAKSGGSGQLAFPAGFVSEIGNIPSGGGGNSGTIDSDYITLEYAIVTVGSNTVSNATQVLPYLYGLAGITLSSPKQGWCCVVDRSGWYANMYVCTSISSDRLDTSRYFYRYKNGAISRVNEGSSYDAKLYSGDKYLVACLAWKGAPTV